MRFVPCEPVAPQGADASVDGGADLSVIELDRLSAAYARSGDPRLREVLILHHQRLVRSIAARFIGSGETLDDLVQVGNIGLINALDRYDPGHGTRFSTYATPTILGEIKRYFRDKTPAVKVPRRLVELQLAARKTSPRLTWELGRTPTTAEVADRLGVPEERMLQAMESGEALNPLSLDAQADAEGSRELASLSELIGKADATLTELETFDELRKALQRLSEREREVIWLRFFDELSQAHIARRLNISQMHVSRLQHRALRRLRELLSK